MFYQKQKLLKDLWYFVERSETFPHVVSEDGFISPPDDEPSGTENGPVLRYDVRIWNRGKSTIEGAAISPADPLTLTVEDGQEIVFAGLVRESRKAVGARISVNDERTCVNIDFKFLDWRDGVVVAMKVRRRQEMPKAKRWYKFGITGTRRGAQLSGSVMGVNQISELRKLPFSGEIAAALSVATILNSIIVGTGFSFFYVIKYAPGIAFAGTFGAPVLVSTICLGFLWLLVWAWHYRFLPGTSNWFFHSDPDSVWHRARPKPLTSNVEKLEGTQSTTE